MVAGITGLVFIIINLNSVFVDKGVFVRTAVWGAEKVIPAKVKGADLKRFSLHSLYLSPHVLPQRT